MPTRTATVKEIFDASWYYHSLMRDIMSIGAGDRRIDGVTYHEAEASFHKLSEILKKCEEKIATTAETQKLLSKSKKRNI